MMDMLLDNNSELVVKNGDFVSAESTLQHQKQLLLNGKASFKQNPTICVGLWDYKDNDNLQELPRAISIQFTQDGMEVKQIELNADGSVKNVKAYYK